MTDKPLKTRVSALENASDQADNEHEYKKVISWDEDENPDRFYRDGVEITRREYLKHASGPPDKVVVNWGEYEQA